MTASVLVFGVPGSAVEEYFGESTHIADVIEVEFDGKWWRGRDLAQSLLWDVIESGNGYIVGFYDGVHDPLSNIVEGGIDFPLSVTAIDGDPVRIVFETASGQCYTYFSVGMYGCGRSWTGPGLIAVEHNGWAGYYVLVNGIMVKSMNKWSPGPVEENGQVRIARSIYKASIIFVFSMPNPGWT